MSNKTIRVGIVAGETSGDILAAGLISAFRKKYPNAIFEGIAGPRMQAVGCQTLFDMEELSVMGLVEVLSRIRRLLHIRKSVLQYFTENPPDVFIGVDAPDFNLTLEMKLKQQGIKTIHYVSPTVWAWRESRVHKIARATNNVFCIFPFEPPVYDKFNIPSEFVGHTLADQIHLQVDRASAREYLNVDAERKVLAMLPGSRAGEAKMLFETFLQSAELLAKDVPDLLVLIPVVNKQRKEEIDAHLERLAPNVEVRTVFGHAQQVMIASNAVLLASGTATLEAMLCKRPMVVAYKLKGMTYQMMRFMYKQTYFALPNILAGKELVPELLQKDVNPELISSKLRTLMSTDCTELQAEFTRIHQTLRCNADDTAASSVARLLKIEGT
ncbi:lipid-A-disaccharide synthase [Planctobacterium marinum]|uniref:Lipid-A-disaccharide synthase n=1 Tax=Planctobacterium marinum TaxID=1631968 RepID=A0AA48HJI3_9ALTE|nr:lipid-A-disaccharide synthase [Planctobacterium marinum]